jgi:hypothetical protein
LWPVRQKYKIESKSQLKEVDMSKDFANLLYEAAENVEVAIAAQDLFKTGKICISEAIRGFCIQRANKLFYPYRKAVLKAIEY